MLIAAAERFAREQGCARLEVIDGFYRPGANDFYEALGYELIERRFVKLRT